MAREVLTVILFYVGHLFTVTDGAGDSLSGSSANSEALCRGERSLLGDGFHRDLKTYLVITARNEVELPMQCETLLIENLSASFYIDPYQIETAQEFGGPKLELHGNVLSTNVAMPLHVRYHKPLDDPSHVPVEVLIPEVYIACHPDADWLKSFDRTPAPCSKDTSINCTWTQISCSFPEESLSLNVPVGNLQHFSMIAALTVLIISISTAGLIGKMLLSTRSTAPSCTAAVKKHS